MSQIDVKGFKEREPTGEATRERFLFDRVERLSRLPLYIALAITGIVAYFKSAMPSASQAEPVTEEREAPTKEARPAPVADGLDDGPRRAPRDSDEPEESKRPTAEMDEVRVSMLPAPRPLVLEDSFAFQSPPLDLQVTPLRPIAAANDNSGGQPVAVPPGNVPDNGPGREPPAPTSRNRAPVATGPVRLNDVMAGQAVLIGLSELLGNIIDADGDALTVRSARVSSGSIGRTEDGWVFSSNRQAEDQTVVLAYEVSDGTTSIIRTATFEIEGRVALTGTAVDDMIVGLDVDDEIDTGAGNNIVDARGGDDFIVGGAGDDHIIAGAGDDVVRAGSGNDIVLAGAGNDVVSGGAGDDRIKGDGGNDILSGDAGNDRIDGGTGDDIMLGGDGDDVLEDGAGQDDVFGEAGNDTFMAAADGDADYFDGGEGADVLDLSATAAGVEVDHVNGTISGIEVGNDRFSGFEAVIGGTGDDTFRAGDQAVMLTGGGGDDSFYFDVAMTPQSSTAEIIHKILDFMVGDQVWVADYEFRRIRHDGGEDRFERIYRNAADDLDDDEFMIRLRNDATDQYDYAVIEVDRDRDDVYEFSIEVYDSGPYGANHGAA